ncbi:MAG: threonine synthase [Candidatus Auribacterota bacterium]|jgi:threonine synthase|nr:threonine synthase [Candidatus Auribacterota bacterium]
MSYKAWFKCFNDECGQTYPLDEIVYECKKCGSLLEVEHDMDALADKTPDEWKKLFEKRSATTSYPYGSGVWGKKEWVLPQIDNRNVVSLYEGNSNLFWAERFGQLIGVPDVWIKLCGNSHTGSFKDLGMTVLVSQVKQMIAGGAPIRAVACASTGDTSAALAAYCAAAGIPSIVLLPHNKISTAQLVQPLANGAKVFSLNTDFDGCMALIKQLTRTESIYLANSMNSLRIEGQKSISIEICQQFDWEVPDVVIIPGGNLGNVSALGNGFQMMRKLGLINRLPQIILAQAAQANPLYLSYLKGFKTFEPITAGKTMASAIQIGNPVSVHKAIKTLKEFDGIVEQATEEELANASALGDRTGMYNCPHTGVALAVLLKMIKQGVVKKDHRVVVISTAHGLKFSGFKVAYHQRQAAGIECEYANAPVELEPNLDSIFKELDKDR